MSNVVAILSFLLDVPASQNNASSGVDARNRNNTNSLCANVVDGAVDDDDDADVVDPAATDPGVTALACAAVPVGGATAMSSEA
jgi:hypothetical protein